MPAVASSGPTASTSWLPDGPTSATAFDEMIACVFVVASDGSGCVSSWAIVTWMPSDLLSLATAALATAAARGQLRDAGPVNGASIAIDALQAARGAGAGSGAGGTEYRPRCERHHPQRAEEQTPHLHVCSSLVVLRIRCQRGCCCDLRLAGRVRRRSVRIVRRRGRAGRPEHAEYAHDPNC